MTRRRPSFADLWTSWPWQPIRNCPGRYTLATPETRLPIKALVGDIAVERYQVPMARDVILVAPLKGGGLISYARLNGTFKHTLNTSAGFDRKLLQLGIALI